MRQKWERSSGSDPCSVYCTLTAECTFTAGEEAPVLVTLVSSPLYFKDFIVQKNLFGQILVHSEVVCH